MCVKTEATIARSNVSSPRGSGKQHRLDYRLNGRRETVTPRQIRPRRTLPRSCAREVYRRAASDHAYLADLLGRIGEHPINRITELLPWKWRPAQPRAQAA